MPPRRGGRGRGRVRARPPQVIRNSMQEIGMGSIANYEAMVKAAASANADAARAYFPVLSDEKTVKPVPLIPSEHGLVKLAQNIQTSIRRSPLAVTMRSQAVVGGCDSDITLIKQFFRTGSTKRVQEVQKESIWEPSSLWIISEMLPAELRPPSLRHGENGRARKRRRVTPAASSEVTNLKDAALNEPEEPADGAQGQMLPNAENAEGDAEDGDQNDLNAGEAGVVEDEDDLELDADYQTGVRFDDDDGYEEADSGAEEATF